MFPEEEVELEDYEEIEPGTGESIGFDYKENEIPVKDGRILLFSELEALKIWIMKQINTEKERYAVYEGVNFGMSSLKDLVTSDFPELFIRAQIEEEITERLLEHPDITDVSDFEFTKEKRTWNINFTVYTSYGEVREEVVL